MFAGPFAYAAGNRHRVVSYSSTIACPPQPSSPKKAIRRSKSELARAHSYISRTSGQIGHRTSSSLKLNFLFIHITHRTNTLIKMNIFTGLLALCGMSKPQVENHLSESIVLNVYFHFSNYQAMIPADHRFKFDEITTVKGIGRVPSPYFHLLFSSYNVFTPGDPVWNGTISKNDRNCAVSAPNALIGSRYDESDPDSTYGAHFKIANATAMMEDSLSPYFTLTKFKIKPLDSPPEPSTTLITVVGYKYNSNQTVKWEVNFDQGYHEPLSVNMKDFSRENWDYLSGVVIVADYGVDALDWEFCIDDLELQFSHIHPELQIARQQDQVVIKTEYHDKFNLAG